jgi:lycopene cyclase domain-containing protein
VSVLYGACLLLALAAMVALDARFRLFFWRRPIRAAVVMVIGVGFFVAWDLAGIALGVFSRGENGYTTGLLLAPELPVEELVFLTFLCYLTMVLLTGAPRLLTARRERGR